MLQYSDNPSNKQLMIVPNNISLMTQLKELSWKEGDYIRLSRRKEEDADGIEVSPIYQIVRRQRREASQKRQKEEGEYQFVSGTQLFLKHQSLLAWKSTLVRPYIPNHLYMQLQILPSSSFLHVVDSELHLLPQSQTESIWIIEEDVLHDNESNGARDALISNFVDGSYLSLDELGSITLERERALATRWHLQKEYREEEQHHGNTYQYQELANHWKATAKPTLLKLTRNKSKEDIKRIIQSSLYEKELVHSKQTKSNAISLILTPVEEAVTSIHLELTYSKYLLGSMKPSLAAVKSIMEELIFYSIAEFVHSTSIVSEHMQVLMKEYGIVSAIVHIINAEIQSKKAAETDNEQGRQYKESYFKRERNLHQESELHEDRQHQEKSKQVPIPDPELIELIRWSVLPCNQANLQEYLPLLDELMRDIQCLKYFIEFARRIPAVLPHFHKRGWYAQLITHLRRVATNSQSVSHSHSSIISKPDKSKIAQLLQIAAIFSKYPPNQYLIAHTLQMQEISGLCLLQVYTEGLYVFVGQASKSKQIELHTFIQGEPNAVSNQILPANSHVLPANSHVLPPQRMQSTSILAVQDPSRMESVRWLRYHLELLQAICYQNPNILPQYSTLFIALLPYTYKANFPVLHSSAFISAILKLVQCFPSSLMIESRCLVGVMSAERTFENDNKYEGKKDGRGSALPKRLLKQMGQEYLKKVKASMSLIKKKQQSIGMLLDTGQSTWEWLSLMRCCLQQRCLRMKQKQQAQFMQYITKLFDQVNSNKRSAPPSEEHLIQSFLEFLIEIIRFNPAYDDYLERLKLKRVYEDRLIRDQIVNKVISNFTEKEPLSLSSTSSSVSKIELVEIYARQTCKSKDGQGSAQLAPPIIEIKKMAAQVVCLILQNINEEMLQESIETLVYFMKNPTIFSSFSLLESFPNYPLAPVFKKSIIEQWYLASDCSLFCEYTTCLRMLFDKDVIHRRNLDDMLILDDTEIVKAWPSLRNAGKWISRISHSVTRWSQPQILDRYPQVPQSVRKCLQGVNVIINKYRKFIQLRKMLTNSQLIHGILAMLRYLQSSNPIVKECVPILSFYAQVPESQEYPSKELITIVHTLSRGYLIKEQNKQETGIWRVMQKVIEDGDKRGQGETLVRLIGVNGLVYFASLLPMTSAYFNLWLKLPPMPFLTQCAQLYHHLSHHIADKLIKDNSVTSPAKPSSVYIFLLIAYRLLELGMAGIPLIAWFKVNVLINLDCKGRQAYEGKAMMAILHKLADIQTQSNSLHNTKGIHKASSTSFSNKAISDRAFNNTAPMQNRMHNQAHEEGSIIGFLADYVPLHLLSPPPLDASYLPQLCHYLLDVLPLAQFIPGMHSDAEIISTVKHTLKSAKLIIENDHSLEPTDEMRDRLEMVERWLKTGAHIKSRKIDLPSVSLQSSRTEESAAQESKCVRKWRKALRKLPPFEFNCILPAFRAFTSIYEPSSDDAMLAITAQDLLSKLSSAALNAQRLSLPVEDEIWVWKQLLAIIKSDEVHGIKPAMTSALQEFSDRPLIQNYSNQMEDHAIEKYKYNALILSLKLQCVKQSKLFPCNSASQSLLSSILYLLSVCMECHSQDYFMMRMLNEEANAHPFDLIIQIVVQQMSTASLAFSESAARIILTRIGFISGEHIKYERASVMSMLQSKLPKEILNRIILQVGRDVYHREMINLIRG